MVARLVGAAMVKYFDLSEYKDFNYSEQTVTKLNRGYLKVALAMFALFLPVIYGQLNFILHGLKGKL